MFRILLSCSSRSVVDILQKTFKIVLEEIRYILARVKMVGDHGHPCPSVSFHPAWSSKVSTCGSDSCVSRPLL